MRWPGRRRFFSKNTFAALHQILKTIRYFKQQTPRVWLMRYRRPQGQRFFASFSKKAALFSFWLIT
jgi:hypothetical protein